MSKKHIPADERVQLLTREQLDGQHTIRADETGPDVRVFGGEQDEGKGFPLRADDEWCIDQEAEYDGVFSDGLWVETETSQETYIQVLKGVCLRRNVRRRQSATIEADTSGLLKASDQPLGTDPTDRAAREIGKARMQDSAGTLIDPATEQTISSTLSREIATWSAGTLPVEQQSPVGVEDSTGSQIDPAESVDGSSTSDTTTATGSGSAASASVPDGRTHVTAAWDISGSAQITVEVSPDGGSNWYQEFTTSPGSAETGTYNFETGCDDVRVYVDSNLNNAAIAAKGA